MHEKQNFLIYDFPIDFITVNFNRLNEPGYLNDMQYWSENHQIGWKTGKHLIGQAFANNPELENLIFIPSQTNGAEAQEIGGQMAKTWLEYRSR